MIYLFINNADDSKPKRSTQVVRPLVIGREPAADIPLTGDKTISRLHALVVPRSDGRLEIRDLSSASGTFVESRGSKRKLLHEPGCKGAEKGRAVLSDGEKFYIGKYAIELHYEELLGEPTVHPEAFEEDKEITAVTGLNDEEE